jgi:hypothetical protein
MAERNEHFRFCKIGPSNGHAVQPTGARMRLRHDVCKLQSDRRLGRRASKRRPVGCNGEFYESDCQGQISPSMTKSLSLQSAPNFDHARVCVWIAAFNSCQIENAFSALRFFWCEP